MHQGKGIVFITIVNVVQVNVRGWDLAHES